MPPKAEPGQEGPAHIKPGTHAAHETKLKLAIPAQHASRVWQVLASHPREKLSTRKLFTVYYDTPDALLARHGVALGLRRQAGRWVQTVVTGGDAACGMHRREIYKTGVAAQLVSFSALVEAGLGDLIENKSVRDSFDVVFTADFSRTAALLLPGRENSVYVSLDRGEIRAGSLRDAIVEVGLELKTGVSSCLFDLASQIAEQLPVRLENRSKAQRGDALVSGIPDHPVKASAAHFGSDDSLDDAITALACHCLAHLQVNETGLLANRDPEYLHQARVALRRLRSAFRLFSDTGIRGAFAPLREELKQISQTFGQARNWDVLVDGYLKEAAGAAPDDAAMATLLRRAQARRRNAKREALATVAAPRYTLLLIQLRAMLESRAWQQHESRLPVLPSLPAFARKKLRRLHRKILERSRDLQPLRFEDLHRLRIDLKRLRDAMDFFRPLALQNKSSALRELVELQDLLGQINDAATAGPLLDNIAGPDPSPAFQQAVGFARGWMARDTASNMKALAKTWKAFLHRDFGWHQPPLET